ncbi:Lsr2 dimerization domain-containing protein [Pengzhenrongella sp.]|jgi:hypothetical protein|uniref:Lsr2 dimerization domain-containing protein n=1 Tax=Pengzhenrongella sp. TaxID=2888820 RepID=UPI002F91C7F4
MRSTVITLVDDTDVTQATAATQTVQFGLDGQALEIDLCDENAAQLRGSLQRFVAAARRTGGRQVRGTGQLG